MVLEDATKRIKVTKGGNLVVSVTGLGIQDKKKGGCKSPKGQLNGIHNKSVLEKQSRLREAVFNKRPKKKEG